MRKLTPEEELEVLNECIEHKRCERLARQYWNLIYRTVEKTFIYKSMPLIKEELEEVQQDVFVRLFDDNCRRLRQYRPDGGRNLAGWIILIANRTALNHLRGRDPHGIISHKYLTVFEELKEKPDSRREMERIEARQSLLKLLNAVGKLPPLEQEVFNAHFFDGLDLPDIAKNMGKEIGNIYTIKSRAIKHLKNLTAN